MRSSAQIFDHQLLTKIANGDEEAFCLFFHSFKNKIYSFSFSITRSAEPAEEITQDVFIRVWTNRQLLNDIENLDAWLSTITRNLCFSYLKKLALEKRLTSSLLETQVPAEYNTEHYLFYKDRRTQVAEALNQLSPQQRLIFKLNRDEGLKNDEIARRLNLSPNTVKTHMVTALKKLRSFLQSNATHLFGFALLFLKKF